MKTVLFACVHNAGRSQMAAALFNRYADPQKAVAISAGTQPGRRVHPEVLETMKELDVDLSHVSPQFLSDELAASVNVLVTMGCGEACPVVPGVERHDWLLEDPKDKPIERVREIRNEVRDRTKAFLAEKGWFRQSDAVIEVAPARSEDEGEVRSLLTASALPVEGLDVGFLQRFVVARLAGSVVGCAGIEVYGTDALLRSLAVAPAGRSRGLGSRLVEDRWKAAASEGLSSLYLITTTAAVFFEGLGFEHVERASVPAGIRQSAEFVSICPSSAAVLRRSLKS
jgi:arsenate reductase